MTAPLSLVCAPQLDNPGYPGGDYVVYFDCGECHKLTRNSENHCAYCWHKHKRVTILRDPPDWRNPTITVNTPESDRTECYSCRAFTFRRVFHCWSCDRLRDSTGPCPSCRYPFDSTAVMHWRSELTSVSRRPEGNRH